MTKGHGRNPGFGGLQKHLNLKAHKEREQLSWRRHIGTLEKHRDYVQRSKIFHTRESRLRNLRKKAAERNPEEFSFEMIRGRLNPVTGCHITNAYQQRSAKEQRKLNARDIRYLEWRRNALRSEIRKSSHSLDCRETIKPGHSPRTYTKFLYADDPRFETEKVNENDKLIKAPPKTNVSPAKPTHPIRPTISTHLIKCFELQRRVDRALQGMKLEQNLLSKGRRYLERSEDGYRVFKWMIERSR